MKRTAINRQMHRIIKTRLTSEMLGHSESQALDNFERSTESAKKNWSRRNALKAALSAGTLAALFGCQTRNQEKMGKNFESQKNSNKERVIIIGGGIAGLTCAYRMMQSGTTPILFEASERLGGRIFTRKNFNAAGHFCELGAELVDSTNEYLLELAGELGLTPQGFAEDPLPKNGEAELFFFKGKSLSHVDFFKPLAPLLKEVAVDLKTIFPDSNIFFPTYKMSTSSVVKEYDKKSLGDYFNSKNGKAESWLLKALTTAYETEYGGDIFQQSSLNFLYLADTDLTDGFTWYGASDEWGRIKGGNSRITEEVVARIQNRVDIRMNHSLESLTFNGTNFKASFRKDNSSSQIEADKVVIALPFSVLREIEGFKSLKASFSQAKQASISNLGYGTNAKFMVGFKEKYWREDRRLSKENMGKLPPSQGAVITDLTSGQFWETSRAQFPSERNDAKSKPGILTNFLGGKQGENVTTDHLKTILSDTDTIWPGLEKLHDSNSELIPWARLPMSKGSYTCPGKGQYTQFIGSEGEPELNGRLHFIGEHTSANWIGFMEGAIESGTQAAFAITGSTQSKKQPKVGRKSWKKIIYT